MLDHISISHQSGLVLWSRSFTPTFSALVSSPASPVNALIKSTFIEGKAMANGEELGVEKDGYSVRWTVENGLGLVFVVVFPALLPLTYIPTLLERTKALFLALFQPYLKHLVESLSSGGAVVLSSTAGQVLRELKEKIKQERWDKIWDRCLRNCEGKSRITHPKYMKAPFESTTTSDADVSEPNTGSNTPLSAEEMAKNMQAVKARMKTGKKRGAGGGGSIREGLSISPSPSPSRKAPSSATAKLMRRWGDTPVTVQEMAALDYSTPSPAVGVQDESEHVTIDKDTLVSVDAMGKRGENGAYEVAEWDFAKLSLPKREANLPSEEEILAMGTSHSSVSTSPILDQAPSAWSNVFSRLSGSKTLTQDDLAPVLVEMEKQMMSKNVAKNIAERLCESIGAALVGKKMSGLSSVKSHVQSALSASLTHILTPKTSTDILLEIQRKRSAHLSTLSSLGKGVDAGPDPYILAFIGVNGVGKSTNLSKVCFWLLQNGLRVLIAACDTFRSGAVEQLRVHVRNLGALGEEMGQGKGKRIELFERGYGKDAAGIARDAIAYAKQNAFDVVLIDTAGRMQDNEPLMRALAKLIMVNNPDKIIFVGEALVGNEAVDQLSKFDMSLKNFSGAGAGGATRKRGIDGIILTKFDTIDDKVGAALSMTYITGQPILFVGCGQTYTDLRQLRVNHIVQALLS
nr:signal recognition particle receptor subunit alpha [Cryptococcus depauperatus CBS 7855]